MKPSQIPRAPRLLAINATSLAVVAAAAAIGYEHDPLARTSYLIAVFVLWALAVGIAAAITLRVKHEQRDADAGDDASGLPRTDGQLGYGTAMLIFVLAITTAVRRSGRRQARC